MKKISIVLFLVYSYFASACMCASQIRSYFIGSTDTELYFLETDLQRSDYVDPIPNRQKETQSYWFGETYLRSYNYKKELTKSTLIEKITILPYENYNEKIEKIYQKAVEKIQVENFKSAQVSYFSFCDFQKKCEKISILSDKVDQKMKVARQDENFPIEALSDKTSPEFALFFYDEYNFERLEEKLFINSIRSYNLKDKTLWIVHIQTGNTTESAESEVAVILNPKEHKPEFAEKILDGNQKIYEEPALTHAKGFDFFFLEDHPKEQPTE